MENTRTVEVLPPGILSLPALRRRCLSMYCNVLRESLSVDSQNIPCATLKRRGVLDNLCISLIETYVHNK
jgi:hypothetical protein